MAIDVILVSIGEDRDLLLPLEKLDAAAVGSIFPINALVMLNGRAAKKPDVTHLKNLASIQFTSSAIKLKPSEARNQLLDLSHGDWVFFIDDDAYPDEKIFQNFYKLLVNHKFDIVGGPNLQPATANWFQKSSDHVLSSYFGSLGSYVRYTPSKSWLPATEQHLTSCNLFVRGTLAKKLAFNEKLSTAEESDFLIRARKNNYKIFYACSLIVYHERRNNFWDYIQQIYSYGTGRAAIIQTSHENIICTSTLIVILSLLIPYLFYLNSQTIGPIITLYSLMMLAEIYRARLAFGNKIFLATLYPLHHFTYIFGLHVGIVRRVAQKVPVQLIRFQKAR